MRVPGSSRSGILLLDKPAGISSHSAVAAVRRALGTRKVGHAGTLDPAATGLLVLGVGAGTRLLTFLVGLDKAYLATVRLGVATDTEDAAGEITQSPGCPPDADVSSVLGRFAGQIRQRPSSVSAIKVAGQRAYHRVRAGEDVLLPDRDVTIHSMELLASRPGLVDSIPVVDVDLMTTVSSGTYIRALARDLGVQLGSVGHVRSLRRTAVGPFAIEAASSLADVTRETELESLGNVAGRVMSTVVLDAQDAGAVTLGQRIPASSQADADSCGDDSGGDTALLNGEGDLLAVASIEDGRWRYRFVVPTSVRAGSRCG